MIFHRLNFFIKLTFETKLFDLQRKVEKYFLPVAVVTLNVPPPLSYATGCKYKSVIGFASAINTANFCDVIGGEIW